MKLIPIAIGQRYGRWTVLKELPRHNEHRMVKCRCACGKTKTLGLQSIREGRSESCGCLQREKQTKHGYARDGKWSPEYRIWVLMRRRCRDRNDPGYHNYGGRGIKVC